MGNDRNKPCHCGSGLKYKRCHLPKEQAAAQAQRTVVDTGLPSAIRRLESGLRALPAASLMGPGGEGDLAILRWLLDARDPDGRRDRLYAHPRMFVSGVIEALRDSAAGTGAEARALLDWAEAERHAAGQDHVSFPLRHGPIMRLASSVAAAQMSQAQALSRAATPLVASTMSRPYLFWVGVNSSKTGMAKTMVILIARLLLAATGEGLVSDEQLRTRAAVEFVDAVKTVLGNGPDGPLLAEAASTGRGALATARARGDQNAVADVLFALGTMYLDPYTAERQLPINAASGQSVGYPEEIARWLRSEGRPARGGSAMPPAEQALGLAVSYLRECCHVAQGRQHGYAAKALAQALMFQGGLGRAVDLPETGRLRDEALEHLDPGRDRYDTAMLHRELPGALDAPVFTGSLADLERRYGAPLAAQLVLTEAERLRPSDPRRALAMLQEAGPLIRRAGGKNRVLGLQAEIGLLVAAYGGEPGLADPDGAALAVQAERLLERAGDEGWDARRRAAVLIALAATAPERDEEATGLHLLEQARSAAPDLARDHQECLAYLRVTLLLGAGVNDVNSGDWPSANDSYSAAIDGAMRLGLDEVAYDLTVRVADVVSRGASAASLALATQLAPRASLLEARLGVRATDVLQDAYKQALRELTVGAVPADSVLALLQLAKGRRFASAVSGGSRYRSQRDPEGGWMLDAVRLTQRQLADEEATDGRQAEAVLTEEVLVATYADAAAGDGSVAGRAAESTAAHLADLARRYDAHLSEQLLLGSGGEAALLTLSDLQAALDDRTVLVDLFAGRGPQGDLAIYLLAVTRDAVEFAVVPQRCPDGDIDVAGDGGYLRTTHLGQAIAQLRRDLQEPPLGRRRAALPAEQELDRQLSGLLGPVAEHLASYRDAGKDHLCFVPHGPLHYLPFQLLGPAGEPLAAEWTVTYLPNLHLLNHGSAEAAGTADATQDAGGGSRKPVTAFGLSFGAGWPGGPWPELQGAVPEAEQIAALFGERAIAGPAATSDAVIRALTSARMVHIATHGTYDAFAPAFQSLELWPTGQSGGQLCAHELLGLDLRGLELVTLSACQTALGRFDAADNIRGLPASLLLGGAATVIGTLWPVRDDVARSFFVRLYTALRAGAGRLEAFRAAQADVRQQYPQYRHWGCFYYAGRWD